MDRGMPATKKFTAKLQYLVFVRDFSEEITAFQNKPVQTLPFCRSSNRPHEFRVQGLFPLFSCVSIFVSFSPMYRFFSSTSIEPLSMRSIFSR